MIKNHYNVIVVGAGPAGSTAAICLVKAGYDVLLIDKKKFPRDKSCGDGLTRMSAKLLHDLGLWGEFSGFQKIRGVKIFVDKEGCQEFIYPNDLIEPAHGIVVPRFVLDNILCKKAVESGAQLLENCAFRNLIYDDDQCVSGVRLSNGEEYFSDLVIGADGAASMIAYETNLAITPKSEIGFGIRGYFHGVTGLKNNLEIYLPVLDSSDKYVLPSYGWVFPVNDSLVNIGIGLTSKQESDNVHSIMDQFVQKLVDSDERFSNAKPVSKYMGAPMRFDFAPLRSFKPGLLLAGDAAGMISPFTGEGIGYAIDTAKIAADVYIKIAQKKGGDNFKDLSLYGKILSSKYQGYFETGIHSINRYRLIWKVIKNTFQSEKQLFITIRQAALFPEAMGESFFQHLTIDVSSCFKSNEAGIKTDLIAITQNIIGITKNDWPFLSKMFTGIQATPGIPLSPALFMLLAGNIFSPDREMLVRLGTAMELGYAAALCHNSVSEPLLHETGTPVNWGNMLSILTGDFLLSKSYDITAASGSNAKLIADTFGLSSEGNFKLNRIIENKKEITVDEYLDLVYLKNSSLFELCIYLGCLNSNGGVEIANSLRQFGKFFGAAFQIIEEIRRITGKTKLNNIYVNLVSDLVNLPNICMKQDISSGAMKPNMNVYLKKSMQIAENEISKAKEFLAPVKSNENKSRLIHISDLIIKQGYEMINND